MGIKRAIPLLIGFLSFHGWALQYGEVVKSSRDLKVPTALVKELESWFLKEQKRLHPVTTLSDLEIMGGLRRELLNVEVRLSPQKGEALADTQVFRLPTGGGEIDLAQVIRGSRGGYQIRFNLVKPPENTALRVFYLSNARRRDVEGESYGAGCGKWVELTTWFDKTHLREPLQVYATQQRDVSVLAGTWLFAAVGDGQLWLSAATLTDTRWPQLQCFV